MVVGETSGQDSRPMDLFLVLISVVAIRSFLAFYKKLMINGKARTAGKVLPGPRGLPVLGYLPFLRPNLHQLFMELAQTYGPIYKLSIGSKQCVIVSSPLLAKEVVRDHDITFANRNPTVAALVFSFGGNDIAFAPYGPQWRMLRRVFVREMQSNSNLDSFYPLRRNEVRKTVREVYGKFASPVNVGELAFSTVINMISGMFWGGTLEGELGSSIGAEFRAAVFQLTKILGKPNVSDFFPALARLDLQGVERDMKRVSEYIGKIYDYVIDQRCARMSTENVDGARKTGPTDFLQFLLEFKDQETRSTISNAQIKAMLMDIVIGGTDTTTTMVEWAMAEMMLHPETMNKAQEELDNVVGVNNVVEEFHTQKLTYLHAIVKEALRLHPAAPLLLPRCPTKSCDVGGYTIPEGCKVFLNVWAMHRDPEYWDNPLEFQPERFLNDGSKLDFNGNYLHYVPFGSGRRICAGMPLGERMLMYVLAVFLHMFDWKLPIGTKADTAEKFGIVLEKSTPLVAIPTHRLSNFHLYV